MKKYVAGYGDVKVKLVGHNFPADAEYVGADETYFYYKAGNEFYATTESTGKGSLGMPKIIHIARMVIALEDENRTVESKRAIIDMYKGIGVITEEDAKELIIEYC